MDRVVPALDEADIGTAVLSVFVPGVQFRDGAEQHTHMCRTFCKGHRARGGPASVRAADVAAWSARRHGGAAPGMRLHAVAESELTVRRLAETIALRLGLSAMSIPADQAAEHVGPIAAFLS